MSREYGDDDLRMIRLQEGDADAFADLVEAWQGPLLAFFRRNLRGDLQMSEDLVQETFLRVHRYAWDYLPTGRFRGWLFRIARNLLIDNVRRRSGDALLRRIGTVRSADGEECDLVSLLPADQPEAIEQSAVGEVQQVVRELLVELPDSQRQTFMLHHYDSLTLAEVADAMETSLPTAKSRLRLAREKLRYQLTIRGFAAEAGVTDDSG